MTGYPWHPGDPLLANDLNAAIASASSSVAAGGPFLPLRGAVLVNSANDAAAAAAGVPVGGLYRNGSIVMQRIA